MSPTIAEIGDKASGSTARIAVDQGFNCFSWQLAFDDGPRDMLWAEADFERGNNRPLHSGIPLLFPFAGRFGGTVFSFEKLDYHLDPFDEFGNALHGLVYSRPWRVVSAESDRIVGTYSSADDERGRKLWPSDFRINVSYEICGHQLKSEIEFENIGKSNLPAAFGTHPYFRLPLTRGGDPEATKVIVPATEIWEEENLLMTGRLHAASGPEDLIVGNPLSGRQFDSGYTNLRFDSSGKSSTKLIDPVNGRTLVQEFGREFTQCIVYTPPNREAISLEPWTGLADPPWRDFNGTPPGLKILRAGEVIRTWIHLSVR